MIEVDFLNFLKADTDLTALIGARIFPHVIPQGQSTPALVYYCRKYPRLGFNGNGRTEVQFELNVYSKSIAETKQIEELLINKLHGFIGQIGSTSVILSEISHIHDSYEAATELHRATIEVALNLS